MISSYFDSVFAMDTINKNVYSELMDWVENDFIYTQS